MEFVHQTYQPGETIAAIATPPGEGGVAIVRISGHQAIDVAERIFSKSIRKFKTHTVHHGFILNEKKEKIDEVLILPMLSPKTYTGEDTVEIFCHGGSLITRSVLEVVLQAGARAAKGGEFTFKAFINGKIDLAQAEAVQELIAAKNERALNAAEKQLEGALSQRILDFQKRLTMMAAILEAWVDFPEEGLEFASMEEMIRNLSTLQHDIAELIDTFHDGKILHDGLSLCLVGAPNVGKSSLMNALLEKERAIVSPIPGTTRDILEDQMRLNGLNFRILDTAGIRETNELIEAEGIKRTRKAMQESDLILVVVDALDPICRIPEDIPKEKSVLVWNKCDLKKPGTVDLGFSYCSHVSALKRTGLQNLKEEIEKVIWKKGPPSKEEIVVTNVRHKEALHEASSALLKVIKGLQDGVSPEFLTLEMRTALKSLGKIIGTNISEDILNAIFSTFCIGK